MVKDIIRSTGCIQDNIDVFTSTCYEDINRWNRVACQSQLWAASAFCSKNLPELMEETRNFVLLAEHLTKEDSLTRNQCFCTNEKPCHDVHFVILMLGFDSVQNSMREIQIVRSKSKE